MVKKVTTIKYEDSEGNLHDTEYAAQIADRIKLVSNGVRIAVEDGLPNALYKSGNGKEAVAKIAKMLLSSFYIIPRDEVTSIHVRCPACDGKGATHGAEIGFVEHCESCKGTGLIDRHAVKSDGVDIPRCKHCDGTGYGHDQFKCSKCGGSGLEQGHLGRIAAHGI
ncbi:chaperone protein [Aeromonas phage Gekk3-15]